MISVKIVEEDTEKNFEVSKQMITLSSPYFAAAFNGPFKEARAKTIELKDVTIQTFEHFIHWVEGKGFSRTFPKSKKTSIALFIFGDTYVVPVLRREATDWLVDDNIFSYRHKQYRPEDVQYAYDNTPEGSELRNVLADGYLWRCRDVPWRKVGIKRFSAKDREDLRDYPHEFLVDVLSRIPDFLRARMYDARASWLDKCKYHGHRTVEEETLCKALYGG
jgi:hypothetical protein